MNVESPCIGVCATDANDICLGCLRHTDEIAAWPTLDDEQRRLIVSDLKRRENGRHE